MGAHETNIVFHMIIIVILLVIVYNVNAISNYIYNKQNYMPITSENVHTNDINHYSRT
jgi:hypothetical protein